MYSFDNTLITCKFFTLKREIFGWICFNEVFFESAHLKSDQGGRCMVHELSLTIRFWY